jgi:hypothetical protein
VTLRNIVCSLTPWRMMDENTQPFPQMNAPTVEAVCISQAVSVRFPSNGIAASRTNTPAYSSVIFWHRVLGGVLSYPGCAAVFHGVFRIFLPW